METVAKVNKRVLKGETAQGFYVLGAGGQAHGYNNNRSVERVLAFMAEGLVKFEAAPGVSTISDFEGAVIEPPEGATVLRTYSRIMPVPAGSHIANENLQRDHFWVLASEVSSLSSGTVPESLQLRLCRFAFVDAIRGEPDFWRVEDIVSRSFSVSRLAGGSFSLVGAFEMSHPDRSFVGTFEAVLEIGNGELTSFKGFAEGTASGRSTYTPNQPEGEFPLKIAFILAPDAMETVAPQASFYGRSYLTGK